MSVENLKSQVARSPGQTQPDRSPSETNNQPSLHDSNSSTDSMDLGQVNDVALAVAYQEEVASPISPGPFKKENLSHGGAPPVEESLEARLERLGRQRPEVFSSVWAEIGFVFSISMSQVLSVMPSANFMGPALTSSRNTSCQVSLSVSLHLTKIWISLLHHQHGLPVPYR